MATLDERDPLQRTLDREGGTVPRGAGWNLHNWFTQTQGRGGPMQRNPYAQPGSDREDYWNVPGWRQFLDPVTGTPLSGINPDEHIAPEAQLRAEEWARYRQAQLYGRGQAALRGQMNMLGAYRPGGAAAMLSPLAQMRAQLYAQQASQVQAPDLMFRYREWTDQRRERQAENAQLTAQIVGGLGALLGGVGGIVSGTGGMGGGGGGMPTGPTAPESSNASFGQPQQQTAASSLGMAVGGAAGGVGQPVPAQSGDGAQGQGSGSAWEPGAGQGLQEAMKGWSPSRAQSGDGGQQQGMHGPGGPMPGPGGAPIPGGPTPLGMGGGGMPPQTRAMHSGGPMGFDMTAAPSAAARSLGALEDDLYAVQWALEDDGEPFSLGEWMNLRLESLAGSIMGSEGMGPL